MATPFRQEIEAAILERHCADHPMTEKWAQGELGRHALMGWAVEHYHWISNIYGGQFHTMAEAPRDVVVAMLENWREETDPQRPHLDIVLKFAAANGADAAAVKRGRGLPTTEAWVDWLNRVAREEPWIAGVAAILGTESQSPMLYGKVLPALRTIYKYPEDVIEHFWLHCEADTEHGDREFDILERHCRSRPEQELAIHYARESAKRRWFYFDGIYLHYELGYALR